MLDMNQKLSPHFTLGEMLRSQKADELKTTNQYAPSDEIIANLTKLCQNVLEPLRTAITLEKGFDTPIRITSGYRCEAVNAAVGGVNIPGHLSQHTKGEAADTHVDGMTIEEWYQFIRHFARQNPSFKFDQLIQEFNCWAHISFNPDAPERMQSLRATHGETAPIYTPETL